MRRVRRPAVLALLALLASPGDRALAQPASVAPRPGTAPSLPVLTLGALLPVTGPGTWFGTEIRRGIELAVAELDPRSRRPGAASTDASPPGDGKPARPGESAAPHTTEEAPTTGGAPAKAASPPPEPIEAPDRPRGVQLALKVEDVDPLDMAEATRGMTRVLAGGAAVVFTASPTPTLAVYPLAAGRNVLVVHCGLPTDRLPATSRTLLQLRPSVAARAERLAAYAWERGGRRLGLVADGGAFGRAVRATVAARWRQQGAVPVHDESLSPDASDLRGRLRTLVRAVPDTLILGYQGQALGEMARAVREAGYTGLLLAADDDRAAQLAGGPAMDGARLLGDAFVPEPGTRGERFARAYAAKHGSPPSRFAASAYEAAVLLADAATRVLERGQALTGGTLREVLVAQRRFPSLYGGEVVVGDDGVLSRPLALFRVEHGKAIPEGYVGADGRLLGPPRALGPAAPPAAAG